VNEGFRIRLRRSGRTWPIDTLTSDGIMLNNERDAFPRSVTLEFDARNDITAYRMNNVRELRGWPPSQFSLKATLVDGTLAFAGEDANSLPPGGYWLWLEITDLEVVGGTINVDIDEDEPDALVIVDVRPDSRTIRLTTDIDEFDAEILRVLQAPASALDGMAIDAWLASPNPRPSRKACLLNLMAKLRTVPAPADPLITDVNSIFFGGTERVYGQVNPALFQRLQALAIDPEKPFYDEGNPASATHLKLLDRIEAGGLGNKSDYALHSFRQEGRTSMQVVVATPSVAPAPFCADFDIDLGNPLQDVEGFVTHIGELAFGGETNHLDLRRKLAKGAMKQFLYYTVV
jgi:hypothetical protein